MSGINDLMKVYLMAFDRRSRKKLAICELWPQMTLCWQEVSRRKDDICEGCQKIQVKKGDYARWTY